MLSIAIDGPAGAGKSTLARNLADALGVLYLDTGAMYRAIGLAVLRSGIDPRDEAAVCAILPRIDVQVRLNQGVQDTLLSGESVSAFLRTPEVSMAASVTSAYGAVREKMVALQRQIAAGQQIVLDGRDIGTNVLPDAPFKFFITASPEVRAQRRFDEMRAKGENPDFDAVLADVKLRDHQDSTRAINPLCVAEDAVVIMTDDLDAQGVLAEVLKLIREKQE